MRQLRWIHWALLTGCLLTLGGCGSGTTAQAPLPPSAIAYALSPAVYAVGEAILPNGPSHAGGVVSSYAVTPVLPVGLILDPRTGIIAGTPSSPAAPTTFTVTATNAGGSASAMLTISVKVAIPSAEMVLPTSVHPGDAWMTAQVPNRVGMTYRWTVIPGTGTAIITSGQGTHAIKFSAGNGIGTFQVRVDVQDTAGDQVSSTRLVTIQKGTWLVKNPAEFLPRFEATVTLLPGGELLVAGGRVSSMLSPNANLFCPDTGLWVATGNHVSPRLKHTATLLPNGKVLVTGGEGPSGAVLASCEIYDPVAGAWAAAGDLLFPRANHTATLLPSGKVLVAGGHPPQSMGLTVGTAELYDPATGTWSRTGVMGAGRELHTATLLSDGRVLVVGGFGEDRHRPRAGDSPAVSAEVYDPVTQTWTPTGGLGVFGLDGIAEHRSILLPDGRVLITPGSVPNQAIRAWDPATGIWTTIGQMQSPRVLHSATLIGRKVLLVGGDSSGTAEIFDPATGLSDYTASLGTPLQGHTAILMPNHTVLMAGGFDFDRASTAWVVFDPATATWTQITRPMKPDRVGHTATTLVDGKVLVAGGRIPPPGQVVTEELFDPGTGRWLDASPMTVRREGHTATLLSDGSVLVVGGMVAYPPQASAEVFNPATGVWTPTASGSLGVSQDNGPAALLLNGKALVVGSLGCNLYDPVTQSWSPTGRPGLGGDWQTATLLPDGRVLVTGKDVPSLDPSKPPLNAEIYDPGIGTWSATGSMSGPRNGQTATLLPNGKVLVAGGGAGVPSELYDPATGSWTSVGALNVARNGHTATLLVDGRVLVAGGHSYVLNAPQTGFLVTETSEIYDPSAGTWTLTGRLGAPRTDHKASLLKNGMVQVTYGSGAGPVTETYLP